MTAKLPPDSKADLEKWAQEFINTPSHRRTLHEFHIYINVSIKSDLSWFLRHLRESNGVLFFEALDWNPLTDADLTIYCDASLRLGMGF
ncbi:hypothetical protein DFH07DRAFT_969837 [Mycena maculata]|uniref:Uncharacterized protein n=1 Tax=Mycena maculata TaxID=230809 RepID=A0AAD7HUA4_9AGAR|nr:hypothetical protein DFH07DRAFT_969837 [Mycena maculata]